MKRALITGITGQDGSYLTELLLSKGYEVHGIIRRSSTFNTGRIEHLYQDPHDPGQRLLLHYGDLTDSSRLVTLIERVRPDEVYHLAAQSHVRVSFDEPEYTGNTTGVGTARVLEAIRMVGVDCRFYQASSSEMFGATPRPQSESTRSVRGLLMGRRRCTAIGWRGTTGRRTGCSRATGFCSITSRRGGGETFATRKIARAAARIAAGREEHVYVGNLDPVRDWGFAPEYVEGMWRMLQADTPDDYVLATGTATTVRQWVQFCFARVGLDWESNVRFDPAYVRPTEVDALIGDASKARRVLGWSAQTMPGELAHIMADAELKAPS